MTDYVIDASVAVKWYVPEVHGDSAIGLLDPGHQLHAPDLVLPEFSNVIWKKSRRGEISLKKGHDIQRAFLAVPLHRHSTTPLVGLAFVTANGTGQTVYDCIYLVLAVALRCQLVTADEKFYRALRRGPLGASLLWVEDVPI